ncbi:MAG: DUF3467 domain-containing protein [Chloroflexota bacterium]
MQNQPPNSGADGQGGRRQIRLEIPSNLNATYANAVVISQTHSEIIMDFVQLLPNDPRARVQQRIVMTPANAKSFLQALEKNLSMYENKHGEISMPARPSSLADQLFSNLRQGDDEDSDDDNGGEG